MFKCYGKVGETIHQRLFVCDSSSTTAAALPPDNSPLRTWYVAHDNFDVTNFTIVTCDRLGKNNIVFSLTWYGNTGLTQRHHI